MTTTAGLPAVAPRSDADTIQAMIGEVAALRAENARLRLERDSEGSLTNYALRLLEDVEASKQALVAAVATIAEPVLARSQHEAEAVS